MYGGAYTLYGDQTQWADVDNVKLLGTANLVPIYDIMV